MCGEPAGLRDVGTQRSGDREAGPTVAPDRAEATATATVLPGWQVLLYKTKAASPGAEARMPRSF